VGALRRSRDRYRRRKEQYDVVVVDAGLAGLEAARGLAARVASVLLVDGRSAVDERVATTGIFVRRTLEDFDLPEGCLGPPVRDVVLASPAGREPHLTSDQVEYRIGRMGRLYRRWLHAAVESGAEWAPVRPVGDAGGRRRCVPRSTSVIGRDTDREADVAGRDRPDLHRHDLQALGLAPELRGCCERPSGVVVPGHLHEHLQPSLVHVRQRRRAIDMSPLRSYDPVPTGRWRRPPPRASSERTKGHG
jgi:hypothetical protein